MAGILGGARWRLQKDGRGLEAGQGGQGLAAGFPDPVLFLGVLGDHDLRGAALLELFLDDEGFIGDLTGMAVHFDEEDGLRVAGRPIFTSSSTRLMVMLSMNSSVQGRMWAAMMRATASEAFCTLSNTAIMALEACGGGTSLRMARLIMPRVPSEPTSRPPRL